MADVTENLPFEECFARLEKQVSELRAEVLGLRTHPKGWQRTVGMMPDDEVSRSTAPLGREWRERANEE